MIAAGAPSSHLSLVGAEHVSGPLVDEGRRDTYVQSSAETAECTCPESCERDHEND